VADRRLRWGVLSTANIAREKWIPGVRRSPEGRGEVVAIASRDGRLAETVATDLGIARAHGSYEALLADAEVEAVYIPLPNHRHLEWTIAAARAGKHVLCEKPLALTSADAERMVAACEEAEVALMEAFMYRLHPQWQRTVAIVQGGGVGEPRVVQSLFSYFNVDPGNIRNQAEAGGGALMDIGCYAISLARLVFGGEPRRALGLIDPDPHFATDRLTAGVLDFGGRSSSFTVSTQLQPYQRVHVLGTEGRIELEIPFNAPPDRACRIWHQRGERSDEIAFDVCDQYTIEGDAFSQAILDDTPVPTPLDDAVANMRVIDAVFASARTGAWVELT